MVIDADISTLGARLLTICSNSDPDRLCWKGAPCEHVFHKSCCREWLRQARSCPVCRTDLPIALGLTEQDTRQQLNDEGRGRPPTVNDENLTGEGVQQDIIQFFRNWNFESENPTLNVEAV